MTIENINKVDGLAFDETSNELILLIADPLEWDDEIAHLALLQDKINSYLSFIENKQYKEIYPNYHAERYLLKIAFKNAIPQKCFDFLTYVTEQIKPLNIRIEVDITG